MESNDELVSLKITKGLHKILKVQAVTSEVGLTELGERLIRSGMAKASGPKPAFVAGEDERVTLLRAILDSGNAVIVSAIEQNLKAFALILGHGENRDDAGRGGHIGAKTEAIVRRADGAADSARAATERARGSGSGGKRNKPGVA